MIKTVWTTAVRLAKAPDRWLDQIQDRLDRRGPRRTVSRFKVVRKARALAGRFDVRGWVWVVATGGLLWVLVQAQPHWTAAACLGMVAYGAFQTGASWARRNEVGHIQVVTSCECDPFHDGEDA